MSRTFKFILAANLLILAVLVFAYPHLMIAPGKLIPGHAELETECFSCHTAFSGVPAESCIDCHKPDDIGRLTTKGLKIQKPLTSTPFHQKLVRQECVACHSDHSGVRRFRPTGYFDHSLLDSTSRKECRGCHQSPRDTLHQQLKDECGQCHNQDRWKPATFDHRDYFLLDRDHNAPCGTCHVRNDYSGYTCYGCHEHSLQKIRREHIEEGIRDFDNCVECHRSGDEHDIRYDRGREGGSMRDAHGNGRLRDRREDDD